MHLQYLSTYLPTYLPLCLCGVLDITQFYSLHFVFGAASSHTHTRLGGQKAWIQYLAFRQSLDLCGLVSLHFFLLNICIAKVDTLNNFVRKVMIMCVCAYVCIPQFGVCHMFIMYMKY